MRQTPGHANFRTLELPNFRTSHRAFTLIETALAMLAIGLGLLALFGLGRLGLQSTKETDHDQRCTMMADAIFETLRDYNAKFAANARTNTVSASWLQQWATAYGSPKQIPFPPVANMCSAREPPLSDPLYLRPGVQMAPAFKEDEISLAEWNPRYELAFMTKYQASPVAGAQNLFQVTLVIYPDGDTYSSEYRIFQTTLSNTGGFP